MKIIEPPQLTTRSKSHRGRPSDINEGELVSHQGKLCRIAIASEGIRELSDQI